MFGIMLHKLMAKKWMNFCILLGSTLLIATVVSFPLYQRAAYDRMLQDEFRTYIGTNGGWPIRYFLRTVSTREKDAATILRMEELTQAMGEELGLTPTQMMIFYRISEMVANSTMNRSDAGKVSIALGMLGGLPEHARMVSGEMYSESGLTKDGAIEVVVSQAGMVSLDLLVGEVLEFEALTDASGKPLRILVKGVFEPSDYSDFYWQYSPDNMKNICLMNEELFHTMILGENAEHYTVSCQYYPMFEYRDLTSDQVPRLIRRTDYQLQSGPLRDTVVAVPDYRQILEDYSRKQRRIQATLIILQVPVLIMLGAFLFMISGQMYDMERNEISVIKSRGSSGGQIFRLYFYQSLFQTVLSGALGIPLGAIFARVLGSARNFLEFDQSKILKITYTYQVMIYAAVSMFLVLMIMTLPAIRHSRVTIVKLKQQKAMKKKSWWEKIFLDFILLALAGYGYYSANRDMANMEQSVLTGESLDPLLYISSSLFIVGLGLLFLRLQPLIVQLVYLLGKRFWRPASYASFMENAKNGRKQQFIMLFLIMTISLGMYHATVARTILRNARENAEYMNAADVIVKEVWLESKDRNGNYTGEFSEPDYRKYASLDCASIYTRVIYDDNAYIAGSKSSRQKITVMGIHTKNFGEITWVDRSLLEKHYYEYLNDLALVPDGVLVSENFRSKLGYKVGDTVTYYNFLERGTQGKIVGFVDYWPGYAPTTLDIGPDGTAVVADNYLVVAHYDKLRKSWGTVPYEVWIGLEEGHSASEVYEWLESKNARIQKYVDRAANIKSTVEDPLLQGTNGVLTMGFVVTIILCGVGYLIYWVMSIRSREMIFGVLRACGMHKGELFHMLMNEQIFSGVFSVAAGIVIGKISSILFVPMVQRAYAASNQVLPMKLVTNASDMMRLYSVIAGVMLLCLFVLIVLLFKLNVTKALKLGEE